MYPDSIQTTCKAAYTLLWWLWMALVSLSR